MPTLQTIRRQLFDELDGMDFGFNFTASGGSATAVTTNDPRLRDSRLGPNQYEHAYIFRPTLGTSDADGIRTAGDLTSSSGSLAQTGASWAVSPANADSIELLAVHPLILHNLINDALELEYTEWEGPLVAGPSDNDMESTSAWDGTVSGTSASNATVTKQTTAAEVFSGQRSTRAIATSASGYVQSALTTVRQGAGILYWSILKADIGEVTMSLLDSSGNTVDTATALTEEQWAYVRRIVQAGTSVEQVRVRFTLTTSADEADIDIVGIQPYAQGRVFLPSWADEVWKIKSLGYLTFSDPMQGTSGDSYNAMSMRINRLAPDDWRFAWQPQAGNTTWLELKDWNLTQYPLWLTGTRAWSDFGTLTADTDETNCPLHVIVRRVKFLLGARYPQRFPGLAALAYQEVKAAAEARQNPPVELPNWSLPRVH